MMTSSPPARRFGFSRRLSKWDIKISPYVYISPFFLSFAVFGMFPIVFNVVVALHDWDRRLGQGAFVGLDNFAWVLQQPAFWISLQNTFSIFVLSLVPQLILSLFIAAILDQNLRTKTFWRMAVLVPFVVMPVASAMIFSQVFGQFGLITPALHAIGWFPDVASPFFHDRFLSHIAIATMIVFRWTGYNALIFLAAMQAVPRDLYEAATIDGAGRARQFFSVTIPSIRPTMIFVILTMTVGGLQVFDEARVYDGGGSGGTGRGGADNQWLTTVLYLFNLGFGDWQNRMGQAAAVAWLFALVIVVFTLLNFFLTRSISSSGTRPSRASRAAAKRLAAHVRAQRRARTRARPPAEQPAPPGGEPGAAAPTEPARVPEGTPS